MSSCVERFGDQVEGIIAGAFFSVGNFVGKKPRYTIGLCIFIFALTGYGFATWETENREDKLWVPQDTQAEADTIRYEEYYPATFRFNQLIVQAPEGENVLSKERLVEAMSLHEDIQNGEITSEDETKTLKNLCPLGWAGCQDLSANEVCDCLLLSILGQWNWDLETLQNDEDYMTTLNGYGTQEELEANLGKAVFDDDGNVVSAEAFTISYFLENNAVVVDGTEVDEEGEAWEEEVFLKSAEEASTDYPSVKVDYLATRSFGDEFGDAIVGDLSLVNISYAVAFIFLAANLGKIKCGPGSRWTLALGALVTVGLSTGAGFGMASICGLFFGPVHSLLPFILLGIGVDDAFVIVNAFNRERKVPRLSESNEDIGNRCARALARAGASITVTSATDMVAFGISSSSSLPALASFCAYAAIGIFFLWVFASTFFTATLVFDERRQRDNRRECLCCVTRKVPLSEEDDDAFEEGAISGYFRKYHSPAILSKAGKGIVLLIFAGLLGFGVYGTMNLDVEDTQRAFIPEDSYLNDFISASDEYFPSDGIEFFIVFEGGSEIYETREELSMLDDRLSNKSEQPPYIAEPTNDEVYRNVMEAMKEYLDENGSDEIGNVTLGEDNWPTTEDDFIRTVKFYANFFGPGRIYAQDVSYSEDLQAIDAIRIRSQYVRLTKDKGDRVIDDADRQIEAMDATREMIAGWTDLPENFVYSEKYIVIEGFKIIKKELFFNVGLAIAAVGVIVFLTVASPVTALLITLNVAFCIIEILGFMYALGIVIDSVSVINITLAVGLSVDYSAHVGHSFMTKGGEDKNRRVLEALADIGAAVLSGAISTFLAVVVLLFSSSYVFEVLSKQFALTVGLGITHGLILLPVMLSIVGPKAFSSAEEPSEEGSTPTSNKSAEGAEKKAEVEATDA